ncbi:MAG: glycosyltransferase family protein [Chitinophagales bacterium]|nr:glycosyltransferase family protein [Chitinophagales bacterium]
MKIIAITQARIGSTRLPGKILKTINGMSLLEIHLRRILKSNLINKVIVATTFEEGVEQIIDIAKKINVMTYQGSVDDVLDRFYQAAKTEQPDWLVRVTSDCPLIDPNLLDEVISYTIESGADYVSNVLTQTYPDGQDIEVFRYKVLIDAWKNAKLSSEREHVTPYIRNTQDSNGQLIYKINDYKNDINYQDLRMTVDEENDFAVIERIVKEIGIDKGWKEYVKFILDNHLHDINGDIIRNEGYLKSLEKDK